MGAQAQAFPSEELERTHTCNATADDSKGHGPDLYLLSQSDPAFGKGIIPPRLTSPRKRSGDFIGLV